MVGKTYVPGHACSVGSERVNLRRICYCDLFSMLFEQFKHPDPHLYLRPNKPENLNALKIPNQNPTHLLRSHVWFSYATAKINIPRTGSFHHLGNCGTRFCGPLHSGYHVAEEARQR